MDVCRGCLANCTRTRNSKKFSDTTTDGVRYDEMFKRITQIEVREYEILCSSCCSDLVLCYKFLLKVENANNVWSSSDNCDNKEFVKDPLEDSDEESSFNDDKCEEANVPYMDFHADNDSKADSEHPKESFDISTKSTELTEIKDFHCSIMQECEDEEALFNDLSDLTVSAENLIFPRGRFKCRICEKAYFTTVGLIAHQEVHLPKTPAAKKKRIRGAKKQKISKPVTDTESTNHMPLPSTQSKDELNTLNDMNESSEATEKQTINRKCRKEKQLKPKKMFPCQVCGKHMISASKLRYHMVMHTGEKDFLCSMCPKAYSTIYALKFHFRSHTGDRPYTCTFCGDRFTRPTTLKSHVRRHTGERPYGCDVCGKRFIQHSSMTTHIKLNHMAKTIPCPHCDKKYARQTDLNTHMLSHTGDKPFRCQLCPSRFIRQANLNKHMNQHHSAKSNELQKQNRMKNRSAENELLASEVVRNDITFPSIESELTQDIKSSYDILTNDQNSGNILEDINSSALETWNQ